MIDAGIGPTPAKSLGSGGSGDLSAALSQAAHPGGSEAVHGPGFTSVLATKVVIAKAGDKPSMLPGGVLALANVGPLLLSGRPGAVGCREGRGGAADARRGLRHRQQEDGVRQGRGRPGGGDRARPGIDRPVDGSNPAAMAKAVALAMDDRTATQRTAAMPAFDGAIIANARGPEGAAAANLAASRRLPVLFVDETTVPRRPPRPWPSCASTRPWSSAGPAR